MKYSYFFFTLVASVFLVSSAQGETFFFHNDHLGTPQAVTDKNKNVVWEAEYSPFGEATVTKADVEMNLRLPGQYFDNETGLHYNYFRDYDPSTGRYLQSDPIGLEGGLNTFVYAKQSPTVNIDPYGLNPHDPVTRHVTSHAARGNWDEVIEILETLAHYSDKDLKKLAQNCVSKRKKLY